MGMPGWWEERPYGLLFETSLAAVPAWAPIGEHPSWYRHHLGEDGGEPMVEILAHHQDRWGHLERFDDFVTLLDFSDFDPDAWVQLAEDAGARCAAVTAKHHDGWCWWDAPATTRSCVTHGPGRDIVGDFVRSCAAHGLVPGALYSTTDWSAGDDDEAAAAVAAEQLVDLAGRRGVEFVFLDGATPESPSGCGAPIAEPVLRAVTERAPDLVVCGPLAADPELRTVTTLDWSPPDEIAAGPWELRRGIGRGYGHSRIETGDHLLTSTEVVALLTEVVAKGGHLLLSVGVTASGTVPDVVARRLRGAGRWIERHRHVVDAGRPWRRWGDGDVRYLVVDDELYAVDLSGRGRFDGLGKATGRVDAVDLGGRPVAFHQDDDALIVDIHRPPATRTTRADAVEVEVYRVALVEREQPITLFDPADEAPTPIDVALVDAGPGTVVTLGDGVHRLPGPLPAGVTVRGLGGHRTVVEVGDDEPLVLEPGARLEHVAVRASSGSAAVTLVEVDAATLLGCAVDGRVGVTGTGATVRATRARSIAAAGAERLVISRCLVTRGPGRAGIVVRGGGGHVIESCQIQGHQAAIALVDTAPSTVRANDIDAARAGVRLIRTEGAHVHGNLVKRSVRGIDVAGGDQAMIDGNAVRDGDSGCVVRAGATSCRVMGNSWEHCRVGVLVWACEDTSVADNESIDLLDDDADVVVGP